MRLSHERIHVIGHSLGGQIGPAYARAHPDRTDQRGVCSQRRPAAPTDDSAKVKGVVAQYADRGQSSRSSPPCWTAGTPTGSSRPARMPSGTASSRCWALRRDVFLSVFDVYAGEPRWLRGCTR